MKAFRKANTVITFICKHFQYGVWPISPSALSEWDASRIDDFGYIKTATDAKHKNTTKCERRAQNRNEKNPIEMENWNEGVGGKHALSVYLLIVFNFGLGDTRIGIFTFVCGVA